MQKKGQVTIFIILGLLIVVFVALFFVFSSYETPKDQSETEASAYALIAQCVEDVAISGIPFLAARGGYYEVPPEYLVYTQEYNPYFTTIPYYYNEGEERVLSEEELAAQFEMFLLTRIKSCYNTTTTLTFRELEQEDVIVSFSEYAIEILYEPNVALVESSSTTTISPIEIAIPSSYYHAYTTARTIAEEQAKKANIFCMTCLADYKQGAIENILTEEVASDDFYAIVYAINFTEESRDETTIFSFAGRYTLAPKTEDLRVLPIEDQTIIIGYPYEYTVSSTRTGVQFSDNSDLFDIDAETGIIYFYPDEESVGTHLVEITATDASGNFDSTSFYLDITPVVSPTDISYIGTFAAAVGEQFNYTVSLTEKINKTVYYFDDTSLFDIGFTSGVIAFTPLTGDEVTHEITISATTEDGSTAEEQMTLVIY